jgi:hypothetical protein
MHRAWMTGHPEATELLADCQPTAKSPYCELYRNFKLINYTKAGSSAQGDWVSPILLNALMTDNVELFVL